MKTTTQELRARFDAWLRGEVPPAEEPALFDALAADPALAEEARGCREVVSGLRALPAASAPEADLWPGIAARIGALARQDRRRLRSRRLLGLAAAIVTVVGATAAWVAMHPQGAAAPPATQAAHAAPRSPAGLPVTLAAYAETDQALGAIGDELRRAIESRQEKLPAETRALVFENLRTIDRALAEIEAALRESPADPALARTYIAYRERQIDVLRQANRMAARL